MKTILFSCLAAAAVFPLTQCIVLDENGNSVEGSATQFPGNAPGHGGGPMTAEKGPGSVTIRENGRFVTSIRTAMPHVEETRWHKDKRQIAVKSRGNHGPATIQLFDSRSGRQLGRVMAYEAANGPGWARGMAE